MIESASQPDFAFATDRYPRNLYNIIGVVITSPSPARSTNERSAKYVIVRPDRADKQEAALLHHRYAAPESRHGGHAAPQERAEAAEAAPGHDRPACIATLENMMRGGILACRFNETITAAHALFNLACYGRERAWKLLFNTFLISRKATPHTLTSFACMLQLHRAQDAFVSGRDTHVQCLRLFQLAVVVAVVEQEDQASKEFISSMVCIMSVPPPSAIADKDDDTHPVAPCTDLVAKYTRDFRQRHLSSRNSFGVVWMPGYAIPYSIDTSRRAIEAWIRGAQGAVGHGHGLAASAQPIGIGKYQKLKRQAQAQAGETGPASMTSSEWLHSDEVMETARATDGRDLYNQVQEIESARAQIEASATNGYAQRSFAYATHTRPPSDEPMPMSGREKTYRRIHTHLSNLAHATLIARSASDALSVHAMRGEDEDQAEAMARATQAKDDLDRLELALSGYCAVAADTQGVTVTTAPAHVRGAEWTKPLRKTASVLDVIASVQLANGVGPLMPEPRHSFDSAFCDAANIVQAFVTLRDRMSGREYVELLAECGVYDDDSSDIRDALCRCNLVAYMAVSGTNNTLDKFLGPEQARCHSFLVPLLSIAQSAVAHPLGLGMAVLVADAYLRGLLQSDGAAAALRMCVAMASVAMRRENFSAPEESCAISLSSLFIRHTRAKKAENANTLDCHILATAAIEFIQHLERMESESSIGKCFHFCEDSAQEGAGGGEGGGSGAHILEKHVADYAPWARDCVNSLAFLRALAAERKGQPYVIDQEVTATIMMKLFRKNHLTLCMDPLLYMEVGPESAASVLTSAETSQTFTQRFGCRMVLCAIQLALQQEDEELTYVLAGCSFVSTLRRWQKAVAAQADISCADLIRHFVSTQGFLLHEDRLPHPSYRCPANRLPTVIFSPPKPSLQSRAVAATTAAATTTTTATMTTRAVPARTRRSRSDSTSLVADTRRAPSAPPRPKMMPVDFLATGGRMHDEGNVVKSVVCVVKLDTRGNPRLLLPRRILHPLVKTNYSFMDRHYRSVQFRVLPSWTPIDVSILLCVCAISLSITHNTGCLLRVMDTKQMVVVDDDVVVVLEDHRQENMIIKAVVLMAIAENEQTCIENIRSNTWMAYKRSEGEVEPREMSDAALADKLARVWNEMRTHDPARHTMVLKYARYLHEELGINVKCLQYLPRPV